MDYKNSFLPLVRDLADKACKEEGNTGKAALDPDKIKDKLENIILHDDDINRRINKLAIDLKSPLPEPELARMLGALIRPAITLILTISFIALVLGRVGFLGPDIANASEMDKMFDIFLAIYGPIIGFWFGERSALKMPGIEK